MKEYKIMLKSIRTGEWVRAAALYHRGVFMTKERAVQYAKDYISREQKKEYPNYSDYKIMEREVGEWRDETDAEQ